METMRKFFNQHHVYWVGNTVPNLNKNKPNQLLIYMLMRGSKKNHTHKPNGDDLTKNYKNNCEHL